MNPDNPHLVAIDVETTGLDPTLDQLIEIGAVALDEQLVEVETFHTLVYPPHGWAKPLMAMPKEVKEMHAASGLLDDLKEAYESPAKRVPPVDAEAALVEFIGRHYGDVRPYLLGRNPAFDRAWLEHWTPKASQLLHYRSIDVTGFAWLGDLNPDLGAPKAGRAHRALADAKEAVEVVRWWRDHAIAA